MSLGAAGLPTGTRDETGAGGSAEAGAEPLADALPAVGSQPGGLAFGPASLCPLASRVFLRPPGVSESPDMAPGRLETRLGNVGLAEVVSGWWLEQTKTPGSPVALQAPEYSVLGHCLHLKQPRWYSLPSARWRCMRCTCCPQTPQLLLREPPAAWPAFCGGPSVPPSLRWTVRFVLAGDSGCPRAGLGVSWDGAFFPDGSSLASDGGLLTPAVRSAGAPLWK